MKKKVFGKQLSRGRKSRRALFRSLIKALVAYGSIETTLSKAKAIEGEIEKLVNTAKDTKVANKRMVYAKLANDRDTSQSIYKIATAMKDRKSGFTKMTKLGARKGDSAQMVRLEWSVKIAEDKKKTVKKATKEDKKDTKKSLRDKLKVKRNK